MFFGRSGLTVNSTLPVEKILRQSLAGLCEGDLGHDRPMTTTIIEPFSGVPRSGIKASRADAASRRLQVVGRLFNIPTILEISRCTLLKMTSLRKFTSRVTEARHSLRNAISEDSALSRPLAVPPVSGLIGPLHPDPFLIPLHACADIGCRVTKR
jgi:hypothetical protein